ncbi:MucBP domain-containing protein [Lentilactobacillus hilgardii]|uniref:MucBP domain-containing protein n=1 Tax=Lentilactobacillus hilgardii TaxID=1588 RepID=UPI0039E889F3
MQLFSGPSSGSFSKRFKILLMTLLTTITIIFGFAMMGGQANTAAVARADSIDTWMPNKKLQQLVLFNLNEQQPDGKTWASVNDIKESDMALLAELQVDSNSTDQNINTTYNDGKNYSLEGLQYAINLKKLVLFAGLNYPPRQFRGNIRDLTPIEKLTKLTYVDVRQNEITDVTPLVGLTNLKYLNISFNYMADLSKLTASQYTDGFSYQGQTVNLSPVYIGSGTTYEMASPLKLPGGETAKMVMSGAAVLQTIGLDNRSGKYIVLPFYKGGTATQDGNGGLKYTGLPTQIIPGPTSNPIPGQIEKIIQNDYTYFMIGQYFDSTAGQNPIFTVTLPYVNEKIAGQNVTVSYIDSTTGNVIQSKQFSGNLGDPYDVTTDEYKLATISGVDGVTFVLDTSRLPANGTGNISDKAQTVYYYYTKSEPVAEHKVTVNFVDEKGNVLQAADEKSGKSGEAYPAPKIPSTITKNGITYELMGEKDQKTLPKTFSDNDQTFTYVYKVKSTGGGSGGGSGGSGGGLTTTPATPLIPAKPAMPSTPITPATPITPDVPNAGLVAKKGEAVYAVNKIYLYRKPTFNKTQRLTVYTKKPRINRPMFVVTDYAKSANGKLRYYVKDVNHKSKTVGKTGYMTTNAKYVIPVYYQGKHATITVINPRGVNAYRNKNLTKKVKNYKQGTVLKVRQLKKHNLTTRFVLSNGRHVTANRKLVIAGKHKTPKYVKAKGTVNRYRNVNLTKRNGRYTKKTFKVLRWEYSRTHHMKKHGALRYRVASGYITGNTKYVKVVK